MCCLKSYSSFAKIKIPTLACVCVCVCVYTHTHTHTKPYFGQPVVFLSIVFLFSIVFYSVLWCRLFHLLLDESLDWFHCWTVFLETPRGLDPSGDRRRNQTLDLTFKICVRRRHKMLRGVWCKLCMLSVRQPCLQFDCVGLHYLPPLSIYCADPNGRAV